MKNKAKEVPVTSDELIRRILTVKSKFHIKNYVPIYEYIFGEQSLEEKQKIGQVWNLRITDKKITQRLEFMVSSQKQE
jgi:hypothetical protein